MCMNYGERDCNSINKVTTEQRFVQSQYDDFKRNWDSFGLGVRASRWIFFDSKFVVTLGKTKLSESRRKLSKRSFQRAFLQWRNCENSSDMRIILSGTDENDSVSVKGEETNPRTASTRNALTHFPAEIYEVLRWSKLDRNRKTARHAKAKDPSVSLKSSSTLTPFDSLKEEVMIRVSFTSQQVQLERLFRSCPQEMQFVWWCTSNCRHWRLLKQIGHAKPQNPPQLSKPLIDIIRVLIDNQNQALHASNSLTALTPYSGEISINPDSFPLKSGCASTAMSI